MNRHNKGCQHYFDDTKMHNVVAKVDSGIERDAPPPLGKNLIEISFEFWNQQKSHELILELIKHFQYFNRKMA